MKPTLLLITGSVLAIASCAQPERNVTPAKAGPVGTLYEGIGKVTLHSGQPCTPQIMFDFRRSGAAKSVWLAAPMRQSKMLTDAAKANLTVHIWGAWQPGRSKECRYVAVTKVEL